MGAMGLAAALAGIARRASSMHDYLCATPENTLGIYSCGFSQRATH